MQLPSILYPVILVWVLSTLSVLCSPVEYSTLNGGRPYYTLEERNPRLPHHDQHDIFPFQNIQATSYGDELFIDYELLDKFVGSEKQFGKYTLTLVPLSRPTVQTFNPSMNQLWEKLGKINLQGKRSFFKSVFTMFGGLAKLGWKQKQNSKKSNQKQVVTFSVQKTGSGSVKIKLPSFLLDPENQMLAAVITAGRSQEIVGFNEGIALDNVYRFAIRQGKLKASSQQHPKPVFIGLNENEDTINILLNMAPAGIATLQNFQFTSSVDRMTNNQALFKLKYGNADLNILFTFKQDKGKEKIFVEAALKVVSSWGFRSNTNTVTNTANLSPAEVPYAFGSLHMLFNLLKKGSKISASIEDGIFVLKVDKNMKLGASNERYWYDTA